MNPSKRGRSSQDNDIPWLEAVHRLLISFKTEELLLFGDFHFRGKVLYQFGMATFQSIGKNVCHRNQLNRTRSRGKRVRNCPAASTTATYDSNLNGLITVYVHIAKTDVWQNCSRCKRARNLEHLATSRKITVFFFH